MKLYLFDLDEVEILLSDVVEDGIDGVLIEEF